MASESFYGNASVGDLCRSILRYVHQENDSLLPWRERGAFYVRFERGDFFLYPFDWPAGRMWYRVDPDIELGGWIFNVMGIWN